MLGRVNKMCFKHIYTTFQSISVQTHQSLMLIDFNFAKIRKHPDRPPLTAFACSTVSQLRVKTDLVRMGHKWAALNKKWSHDLRMLLQIFHLHFRWDFAYMQLFSCLYKNKCTDICNNKEQAPFPRFCHLIWVVHWLYSLLVPFITTADWIAFWWLS